jgi:hypothetical protein
VVVLALALGIGGFTAFLLGDEPARRAEPAASAGPTGAATTATATPATAAAAPVAAAAAPVAAAAPTGEFRSVKAGQCLVNDGTDDDPRLRLVACAPGTYEVLRRVDGTIDYERNCVTVPGYQFHFFYDSDLDSLDFVLCMRRR